MTREESKSIEYLNTLYMALAVFPNQQISLGNVDEMKESVSMAIQALSQEPTDEYKRGYDKGFDEGVEQGIKATVEPCDDAISREACLMCLTGEFIPDKEYKPEELIAVFSKRIKQLPSVTQKPIECDDAISRQAVFDLMRSLTKWYVRSEDGKFNNVGLLYDDVMFGIDKLPSVTQKPDKYRKEAKRWKNKWLKAQKSGKWIPFSERLPKPFEHCLITTTDGEVIYHYDDGHYSKYKAWMPLPKPYKPQERSE